MCLTSELWPGGVGGLAPHGARNFARRRLVVYCVRSWFTGQVARFRLAGRLVEQQCRQRRRLVPQQEQPEQS
jgi:hypothetical protein